MATQPQTPMAPLPPVRHPARTLSRKNTNQTVQRDSLPNEYLDIWEHATLLFHGFEWAASAETFLMLSRQISHNTESTLCLLNAAMVFARLGEFATASQILNEAEPEGDLLPFTMFIMGHVEFEQDHYDKSEDCFKVALHSLNGPSQNYARHGLAFTLRASHINQNLRIFDTKNNLFGILGTIGALPADGVFESPARPSDDLVSPAMSRSSSDSEGLPALSEASSPSSYTASPIDRQLGDSASEKWWQPTTQDELSEVMSEQLDLGDVIDLPNKRPRMQSNPSYSNDPQAIGGLVKTLLQRQTPTLAAPRRAPRHNMEPRDARVRGNSVTPLASFIRQMPSQNAMEPRSAEVDSFSTNEMAKYLKGSGPGDTRKRPIPHRVASDRSAHSGSSAADSIASADLLTDEDLIRRSEVRGQPAPPSKHPYRSGVGAALLSENFRGSTPEVPARSAARHSVNLEPTSMDTDSLHSFLCGGTSDRDSASSFYGNTNEVPEVTHRSLHRVLNDAPISRAASVRSGTRAVHPALRIPFRTSSLRRSAQPQAARPETIRSTSIPYDQLPDPKKEKTESGFSQFFPSKWARKMK